MQETSICLSVQWQGLSGPCAQLKWFSKEDYQQWGLNQGLLVKTQLIQTHSMQRETSKVAETAAWCSCNSHLYQLWKMLETKGDPWQLEANIALSLQRRLKEQTRELQAWTTGLRASLCSLGKLWWSLEQGFFYKRDIHMIEDKV